MHYCPLVQAPTHAPIAPKLANMPADSRAAPQANAEDTAATNHNVAELLRRDADASHAAFTARLVPTIPPTRILGTKMGPTRTAARTVLADDHLTDLFLHAAPHPFLEQDIVHILLLNQVRDAERWRYLMEEFLPRIDNWMVTDAINPTLLRSAPELAVDAAKQWISRPTPYTIRSGIVIYLQLLRHREPTQSDIERIAAVTSSDYYVEMAVAWYFATAFNLVPTLVKPLIESGELLTISVRKRTLRKILESRKTSPEQRQWADSVRTQLKVHA